MFSSLRLCLFINRTWSLVFKRPLIPRNTNGVLRSHKAVLAAAPIAIGNSFAREDYSGYHSNKQRKSPYIGLLLTAALPLVLCASDHKRRDRGLLSAAREGKSSTMRSLLESGVDPNSRHPLGWAPLHSAVINGHLDTVKLLLGAGADANVGDEFSTARRVAHIQRLTRQQVAMVRDREFCSFINHDANYSGFTPLHYAVVTDNQAIVEALLEGGADPSLENNRGLQPSHYSENSTILSLLDTYVAMNKEAKLRRSLEERRAFPLEDRLRAAIVGQEGPITATAAAIRRRENGWGDDEHPLVFLFLGSSGIGKTELAKQIANYMYKDKKESFIRLDMSEYQEKHEVAKLIGAPPGYIGHDQGGQLTSQLSKCPNAVVLFDEVDKAHPDVLTVLLQLFDEGRLTDGQGKTISCKDAIFVMTSNLASDEIADHALQLRREAARACESYRQQEESELEHVEISREFKGQVVQPILKRHFKRDEFLGRITEMVYFLPFSRSELHQLVERELKTWQTRALERHSIDLVWSREVLDVLADGYNVKYGARSIQHEVEKSVINKLAAAYEEGVVTKNAHVSLVVEESDIKLSVQKTKQTLS